MMLTLEALGHTESKNLKTQLITNIKEMCKSKWKDSYIPIIIPMVNIKDIFTVK
ncbi:hypothetical protein TpMuguga_02g00229 [Theileria parva strain Muguga]|uniref:Uncharacterized protein n=1 Tax=Theileria parva TaxID=5875 RepID=Q4N5R1_THEPA|nr:uncharacterized protein TpMuguga_02g00229 [Theileria parva strain Muguga]EAN32512.1 hypothetical protein TpMuguga_02g00229 [Theileria parva strain Muguga]|eukprot:XP_764795.1 hypothetical protein [Theileria parva strain Muguga]